MLINEQLMFSAGINILKQKILAVVFLFLLLCFPISLYGKTQITFIVEEDCPYSCQSDTENGLNGYIQDILVQIFQENGIQTDFLLIDFMSLKIQL